ncbi:unnamed protein product [Linum trigynum]|uniref:Uncharacterized protein n=1 Tax=Linum trigynum TaxID=586398 RepID=A0AAV2ES50_9ROSI
MTSKSIEANLEAQEDIVGKVREDRETTKIAGKLAGRLAGVSSLATSPEPNSPKALGNEAPSTRNAVVVAVSRSEIRGGRSGRRNTEGSRFSGDPNHHETRPHWYRLVGADERSTGVVSEFNLDLR